MLETDRDAHDARVRFGLRLHRPVGERRGMLHERVHTAERDRVRHQTARFREPHRALVVAQVDRDQRAGAFQLAPDEPERILTGQSGVQHAVHGRMLLQAPGEFARGLLLGANPQRQRAQTSVQQIGRERMQKAAGQRP